MSQIKIGNNINNKVILLASQVSILPLTVIKIIKILSENKIIICLKINQNIHCIIPNQILKVISIVIHPLSIMIIINKIQL